MKNLVLRFLIFLVGLPFVFALILTDPWGDRLIFNAVVVIVSAIAAVEMAGIFKNRGIAVNPVLSAVLGALPPLLTFLEVRGIIPSAGVPLVFAVLYTLLFSYRIFSRDGEAISLVLPKLTAYLFVTIYPGFFCSYAVRLALLPEATVVLLVYVCTSYLNDSFAWAAGNLWGRGTRNLLAVSPNKSLVGFLFGFGASVGTVLVAGALAPGALPPTLAGRLALGACAGLTAITGDLVESAFKRSGIVKDSGVIIPGRGGLLDSIDSPLFTAPVFYYLYSWLMGYL